MEKNITQKMLLFVIMFLVPVLSDAQILLSGPQKIVIDAPRNRLLVSNFNTGDIVAIDSAGNHSYFVQNADFTDGLEIVGDTVYGVGSNRTVRAYDLVNGQLIWTVAIPGLPDNYLSSITYDSTGHLFISCPHLDEIYRLRISDQAFWTFAEDNGLNEPNGILLEKENNRIVVIDDSPSPSLIHAISLSDSTVSTLASTSFTRPDGIVRDKYGYYYIGGYYLSGIYQYDPGFSQPPLLCFTGSHMVYPTYDISDHSLLVTHYNANTWERVPLIFPGIGPEKLSDQLNIQQVTPNPFNSSASVSFEVKSKLHVQLDICNATGTLIKTLVDEIMEPGTYSVAWNGTNLNGKQVAGGVYYFRLMSDGIVRAQKAVKTR